jgi:hypothetical protein
MKMKVSKFYSTSEKEGKGVRKTEDYDLNFDYVSDVK